MRIVSSTIHLNIFKYYTRCQSVQYTDVENDTHADLHVGFLENFGRLVETSDRIDFDVKKCTELPDLEEDGGRDNWRDQGRGGGRDDYYGGGGGGYYGDASRYCRECQGQAVSVSSLSGPATPAESWATSAGTAQGGARPVAGEEARSARRTELCSEPPEAFTITDIMHAEKAENKLDRWRVLFLSLKRVLMTTL